MLVLIKLQMFMMLGFMFEIVIEILSPILLSSPSKGKHIFDTQHNNIQHIDNQHYIRTLSIFILSKAKLHNLSRNELLGPMLYKFF